MNQPYSSQNHAAGRRPGLRAASGNLRPEKSARRRLLERATVMGLGFSLAVHLVIMLIAALITVDFGYGDAGGGEGDEVDFAVLTSGELAQTSSPEIAHERFEVAAIETEALEIDMLSDTNADDSVDDLADSIAPSLNPGGGSLTSIDTQTGSAGAGTGEGASFFGLEARGRRFAYIVDTSGSMGTRTGSGATTRWDMTRGELLNSITRLDEHAEFSIVLYSTNAISIYGDAGWIDATAGNKRLTETTLGSFSPGGGTRPPPAFEMIFALDPPPDAIYFMTDGLLANEVPNQIRQMNRKLVPVHCILFGDLANERDARAAQGMMTNIARVSGGKFTHIRERRP